MVGGASWSCWRPSTTTGSSTPAPCSTWPCPGPAGHVLAASVRRLWVRPDGSRSARRSRSNRRRSPPRAHRDGGHLLRPAARGPRRPRPVKVLALAAVPILLVVKQPDLGSGIVMCVVLLVMLVIAGIPNRYLVAPAGARRHGAFAVVHSGSSRATSSTGSRQLPAPEQEPAEARATTWASPWPPSARAACGERASSTGRRPTWHTFPSSRRTSSSRPWESSWASWARPVFCLCSAIVSWRLLRSAQTRPDAFGRLLADGCFTLMAFSVFENAGMAMGIMPVAGIPLPFLSYGGSATVAFFSAVGIALSVHLRRSAMTDRPGRGPGARCDRPGCDPGEPGGWPSWPWCVEMDLPGAHPEVVVHEAVSPWRELRHPRGDGGGNAIAYAWRGLTTPRPLTHEMFTEILDRHGVSSKRCASPPGRAAVLRRARHHGSAGPAGHFVPSVRRAGARPAPAAADARPRGRWVFDVPDTENLDAPDDARAGATSSAPGESTTGAPVSETPPTAAERLAAHGSGRDRYRRRRDDYRLTGWSGIRRRHRSGGGLGRPRWRARLRRISA